jgi:hypothetical protein
MQPPEVTSSTYRANEFATRERCTLHETGWTETLERLDQLLSATRG